MTDSINQSQILRNKSYASIHVQDRGKRVNLRQQGSLCRVAACPRIFPTAEVFAVAACWSTRISLLSRWAAVEGATSPLPQMAVLSQGVGLPPIVQSHSHNHQQVVRGGGGHLQQQGGHCHPGAGGEGGGHRARLVIGGGGQQGPVVLQHNHSDGFW